MNTYAIIYQNSQDIQKKYSIHAVIIELFESISSEYDEGISFIKSSENAGEILQKVENAVELGLSDVVYVMEVSNDFAAHGTTKVYRAVEDSL